MGLGRALVVLLAIISLGLTLFMASLVYSTTLIQYQDEDFAFNYVGDHYESSFNITNGGFFAIDDLSIEISMRNETDHIVMTGAGGTPSIPPGTMASISIIFSSNTTTISGNLSISLVVELKLVQFLGATIRYTIYNVIF